MRFKRPKSGNSRNYCFECKHWAFVESIGCAHWGECHEFPGAYNEPVDAYDSACTTFEKKNKSDKK